MRKGKGKRSEWRKEPTTDILYSWRARSVPCLFPLVSLAPSPGPGTEEEAVSAE